MSTLKEIARKKFGRLTAIEYVGDDKTGHAKWKCVCDCGQLRYVLKQNLLSGSTKSCGCYQREIAKQLYTLNPQKRIANQTKHGATKGAKQSQEYRSWHHMKQRCINTNNQNYYHYGGRGIKVCDRWQGKDGFTNFLADMGLRPSPKHSIDRIDNDGDYTPENCRWATRQEQSNNTRNNRHITIGGVTRNLKQWAEHFNLPYDRVKSRLKCGWSEESALGIVKRKSKG